MYPCRDWLKQIAVQAQGVLPSKRLVEICRWMGSHFHDCIDYNRVKFLVELLEWGRAFSISLELDWE